MNVYACSQCVRDVQLPDEWPHPGFTCPFCGAATALPSPRLLPAIQQPQQPPFPQQYPQQPYYQHPPPQAYYQQPAPPPTIVINQPQAEDEEGSRVGSAFSAGFGGALGVMMAVLFVMIGGSLAIVAMCAGLGAVSR